jgi:hypothetical protein
MDKLTWEKIIRSDPVGLLLGFVVAGVLAGILQASGAPNKSALFAMCIGCIVWMAIARRFPGQRTGKK